MRPEAVRRLAVSSMPHPRRWRSRPCSPTSSSRRRVRTSGVSSGPGSRSANSSPTKVPWWVVWCGTGRGRDSRTTRPWRRTAAPCASRRRRIVRSSPIGWDGPFDGTTGRIQFNRRMKRPVRGADAAHLHGSLIGYADAECGSDPGVRRAPTRWRLFDGLGHFPHEEDPVAFSTELVNWLRIPSLTGDPSVTVRLRPAACPVCGRERRPTNSQMPRA